MPEGVGGPHDEDWYWTVFMEDAGVPLPGHVYLARAIEDVITRGTDPEGRSYVLEVEAVGPLIPDEDWFGAVVLDWLIPRSRSTVPVELRPLLPRLLQLLPSRLRQDLQVTAQEHRGGPGEWEWPALVGKAVMPRLNRTMQGRRLLQRFAAVAPTLAHKGSPRIVRLLQSREVLEPADALDLRQVRTAWVPVSWDELPCGNLA